MFIGHFAPALLLAAERRSPRLGPLFLAAQLVDIAFFLFVILGVERMRVVPGLTTMNGMDLYFMPLTHSLLGTIAFALFFAGVWRGRGGTWAGGMIGALVVTTHWLLDYLVHAPDLTLIGHGERHGLGLWNWPQVAMPLELGLVAIALTYFHDRTRPIGRAGTLSFWLLAAAMLVCQGIDWLGPQPKTTLDPVPISLPLTALAAYALLTALAWWTGRTRERRTDIPLPEPAR